MSITLFISARNSCIQRHYQPVIAQFCRFPALLSIAYSLVSCATEADPVQTELYPETLQPHFKTCAARVGGTYRERALQKHNIIDIYLEPAPDEGPITEECIVRE